MAARNHQNGTAYQPRINNHRNNGGGFHHQNHPRQQQSHNPYYQASTFEIYPQGDGGAAYHHHHQQQQQQQQQHPYDIAAQVPGHFDNALQMSSVQANPVVHSNQVHGQNGMPNGGGMPTTAGAPNSPYDQPAPCYNQQHHPQQPENQSNIQCVMNKNGVATCPIRCHGIVQKTFQDKGYGFISCEEIVGQQVFYHFTQVLQKTTNNQNNTIVMPQPGEEVQFTLRYNQDKRAQAYEILILQEGTVDRLRGPVGQGSVKVLSNASNEGTIYAKNNRTQETFYYQYSYNDYPYNDEYKLHENDMVYFEIQQTKSGYRAARLFIIEKTHNSNMASNTSMGDGSRSNQDPQLQKRRASAISFEKSRNLLENGQNGEESNNSHDLQKRGSSSSSDNKNTAFQTQNSDKNSNSSQKRFKGRVSSMLDNYGFIKRLENLPEIFFHYSAVNPAVTELEIDDDVEFSISSRKGDKGEEKAPCATDITLSKERLIFEEISTHLFYGIVMQVPKNQNGQTNKIEQSSPANSRDAGHLGGVIQCGKDLGYYEYFDKEREGNLYTLKVGDPVKFKICTDVRTDKPRAVKVSVDVEFFKTKQPSFSGPKSLPTYLLKQVKPDILKFFEEAFATEKRETGVIAAVKDGYGFIKCISRDTRLFFHCNEIIDSDHRIRMSDEIEFTVMEDSMHSRTCSGDNNNDGKQVEKQLEKISERNGEKNSTYKTQYQATRIRVLEKGSVQFHTVQDEVYEGQLICEAKEGRTETCMSIKYFRDSVQNSPDSKHEASDSQNVEINADSVQNSEISGKLDGIHIGSDTPVKERFIKVIGLNSFSPEVRVVLEKADTNLELEDLHEIPVFFQIQKSKKTGNRTAVNVLPKEWMKSISVLDDRSETSSIYDAITNSPMKGMKAPANTPHSMLNTPPRKLGLKNLSPMKNDRNGQNPAQNGQCPQIFQNSPKVSNSQSAHQINNSSYNKQTSSSAVKQASSDTPKLSRSISSPLDKCMQKLHTPVKAIKSNPNLLGHSKTHYGYIVTMKDHYGFIESENHEHEVFFHYSEIVSETSLNLEPKSTPNRGHRDKNSDSDKNDNLTKVQTAGFNFGAEVQYIYADKDGKLCAQQVQLLQKGVLTKHEYIDDQLYTGKISRPCKSVDPSQSHYFGEIQVTGYAKENEKRQYEEATPKYNLNFAEKESKEASPNSGKKVGGGKLERRQSIKVDKFPFTIVFSTISLADPQAMIIQGDPVVFKVSTHRLTNQHRAVNITPVRTKQVARIESTKGEYGFISFKVDEKDHRASLSKNGASSLQQNTGNLFFHSSELVGCAMFELQVGDIVEFNVVHNKRTNKYCAAKVRFIETKPEVMANSEHVGIDENTVEATELTSLPGVRQMLRAESNRAPFMRKISQSELGFNAGNVNEVNNSSPKNVPNSPNPRASISSAGDANNNSSKMQQQQQKPSTPKEDTRPERIARFKKTGTNVGESLLRGENQTTRQPTTGKTEIKVGSSTSERKR